MVHELVTLPSSSMEAKLHFIDAVSETEEWEVSSLDRRHELIVLLVELSALIKSGDWNEVSELLGRAELSKLDSFVELMVEGHLVKSAFELHSVNLVVDECLLRCQEQILLQWLAHHSFRNALEQAHLGCLRLQQSKHAPGDTHDWEMLGIVQVVLAGPQKDASHGLHVVFILKAFLCVTWDVDAIEVAQLFKQV